MGVNAGLIRFVLWIFKDSMTVLFIFFQKFPLICLHIQQNVERIEHPEM